MSDFGDRIAAANAELRALRIMQRELMAQTQRITTLMAAAMADDWEDRYVAEGFIELEQHANGDTP